MKDVERSKRQLAEVLEANHELKLQLEEWNDLIENAPIPIHLVNGSGIVIWINQAELDLLGYEKEECMNKHISNFYADKEVIEDMMARLTKKESLKNFPARLLCKNGKIKNVLINSNVHRKEDEFIHTKCFTTDITDLKKEEEKRAGSD